MIYTADGFLYGAAIFVGIVFAETARDLLKALIIKCLLKAASAIPLAVVSKKELERLRDYERSTVAKARATLEIEDETSSTTSHSATHVDKSKNI